jgi:ATP-dependent protease Clp ATPase subunit
VEATGGSPSWRTGHARAGELSCSFCGQHQQQVEHLIVGTDASICTGCVDRVHVVLVTPSTTVSTPTATIRLVRNADRDESCSFCGKSHQRVGAMAAADDAWICSECLDLCREIVADNRA